MEKIIDGVLAVAYVALITFGGSYALSKTYNWVRFAALEKAATGLGSLEKSSRIMTGGKLDY